MSERANVCRCGCGKTRYFGRWYAHDCPTQAEKAKERQRASAERLRRRRREAPKPMRAKPEPGDLPDDEIERRFQAYRAWQDAMRKREQAA